MLSVLLRSVLVDVVVVVDVGVVLVDVVSSC